MSLYNYYVDLAGAGGDGLTMSTPFSSPQFLANMNGGFGYGDEINYFIKGYIDSNNPLSCAGTYAIYNLLPWPGEDPWRIECTIGLITIDVRNSYLSMSGGVLYALGSVTVTRGTLFTMTTYQPRANVYMNDMVLRSATSSIILAHPAIGAGGGAAPGSGDMWTFYKGCSMEVFGSNSIQVYNGHYFGSPQQSWTGRADIQDCVINSPNVTGTFQGQGPSGTGYAIFNILGGVATQQFAVGGSGTLNILGSSNQTGYTPLALPTSIASVTSSDWADSVLGAGILSSPPNGAVGMPNPGVGAPTYTGYDKGLFGSERSGIGAFYFTSSPEPPDPDLHTEPESWSFGVTLSNVTVDQTVSVSNDGTAGSTLLVGTMTGLSAPFSLVNDHVSNSAISYGDSSTFVVRWHPTALGSFSGALDMTSNDPDETNVFYVDGTAAEADISVSPSTYNFGIIQNSSTSQTFTVTNVGNEPLAIQSIGGLSSPFSVVNDNVSDATLAPAGSATLSVAFAPTFVGSYSGVLTINSNDPDTPASSVQVEGGINAPEAGASTRVLSGTNINNFQIRDLIGFDGNLFTRG